MALRSKEGRVFILIDQEGNEKEHLTSMTARPYRRATMRLQTKDVPCCPSQSADRGPFTARRCWGWCCKMLPRTTRDDKVSSEEE